MTNLRIKIGEKTNRLTLISYEPKNGKHYMGKFICDCGNNITTRIGRVKTNSCKSCGCLAKETASMLCKKLISVTHGITQDKSSIEYRLYNVLNSIKTRCYNAKSREYKWYGSRGINLCEEWRSKPSSFIEWALANGYQKGLHIDRINNDGNYEPNNCRFVTSKVNMNNTSKNVLLTYRNETLSVTEMAEKYNINIGTFNSRLFRSKWSVEKSIETPIRYR